MGKNSNSETRAPGIVTPVDKIWLSESECALYLGVSKEWVSDHIRMSGEVTVFGEKRTYWYLRDEIDRYIKARNLLKKA